MIPPNSQPWNEKHYTIPELASRWAVSQKTIRVHVRDRAGVAAWGKANRRDGKRDYMNYRITESMLPELYAEIFPSKG